MSSDSEDDHTDSPLVFILHNAAESGDDKTLHDVLFENAGASIGFGPTIIPQLMNLKDEGGCTPLHLAILNGHVACAKLLIKAGAKVESKCDGNPGLCMAACLALFSPLQPRPGDNDDQERKMEQGNEVKGDAMEIDEKATHQRPSAARKVFGSQAASEMIEALLTEGRADPSAPDDSGRTALHWAAVTSLTSVIPSLLRASKEAHAKVLTSYQQDALAMSELGIPPPPPPPTPQSLLDVQDQDGHTPLHLAASAGHSLFIKALLNEVLAHEGLGDSQTLPYDIITHLKMRSKDGSTALHLAATKGHGSSIAAVLSSLPPPLLTAKNVELLLFKAADRKARNTVSLAARNGHEALTSTLRSFASKSSAASPSDIDGLIQGLASLPPPPSPSSCSTWILSPSECFNHLTAPEPRSRGNNRPPPENLDRLKVLVDRNGGILRAAEFENKGIQWETEGLPACALADVLRCHEWSYVMKVAGACEALEDDPQAIGHLDADTAISRGTFEAALKAAGAVCHAVDKVMKGKARNVFCAVRPPGHHAGPSGAVVNTNDPNGSQGFCLFSNLAIGAAYAMNIYRHPGEQCVQRVCLLDFDVHHGNGTEAVVENTVPSSIEVSFKTPYSEGSQSFPSYKPWLSAQDPNNILFASVQGFGPRGMGMGGWFYPGSGATCDTQPMIAPPSPHPQDLPLPAQHNPDPDHPSSSAAPAPAAPAAPALINPPEELVAVVEDPDGEFTPTTMDRGPLPPSSSSLLDQTSSVPVQGPYALLPPQSTPPGSSLEQSDRPQKEGRPTYRGPRIINVGVPGPGGKRLMWRRAWRDKILPAVVNFNPDLILVSAGFDAHKKEDLNLRFVGVTESDYEWLTHEIIQVANRCCKGRVVSVLEGGYNLRGEHCSAFARSVASHVRALVEVDEKNWDPKESEMERQWEAKRKEAAAAGLPSPATASVPVTDGSHHEGGGKGGGGGVKEAGTSDLLVHSITPVPLKAPSEATEGHGVKRPAESEPGSPAAASNTAAEGGSGAAGYGSSRRGRRGAPVDYAALNAQMEAAEAALAKDKINEGA